MALPLFKGESEGVLEFGGIGNQSRGLVGGSMVSK